jgi:ubiquinone/menaquinone biosynthesis C-methylase UbiE
MEDKYSFEKYVFSGRWMSYWHQLNEVFKTQPESVLVIGLGDSIVANILKSRIRKMTTLDVDGDLAPEVIASVEKIPLADNSFDMVLCAEVLEHLPFEKFNSCLEELRRVAKKNVVLSLPFFGPPVKILLKAPFLKERKLAFKIPWPEKHILGTHYWEIGKRGHGFGKIKSIISKYFKIEKVFVPFENQYHCFFILQKDGPEQS